jgi:hypothetical protein
MVIDLAINMDEELSLLFAGKILSNLAPNMQHGIVYMRESLVFTNSPLGARIFLPYYSAIIARKCSSLNFCSRKKQLHP